MGIKIAKDTSNLLISPSKKPQTSSEDLGCRDISTESMMSVCLQEGIQNSTSSYIIAIRTESEETKEAYII